MQEEARKETLGDGIEGVAHQKEMNQRLPAELQSEALAVKDELAEMKRACADAELRATEATRLWEMEVSSRSKLGVKMIEMEKAAGTWEQKVHKEKSQACGLFGEKGGGAVDSQTPGVSVNCTTSVDFTLF